MRWIWVVWIAMVGLAGVARVDEGARFVAPTCEAELARRVEELRGEYAPFLRSLPQDADVRERTAIEGGWRFTYEVKDPPEDAELPPAPPWFLADFDDSAWEPVTVPEWRYRMKGHDSAVDSEQVAQWSGRGTTTTSTICWYRTTFPAKTPPAGRRLWLCFDGADWEAEVYLNGTLLGRHRVYYEPFCFDVTDKVRETNTLAVRIIDGRVYGEPMTYWSVFPDIRAADQRYVRDPERSIRGHLPIGYHGGTGFGIHREVYLEETGPVLVRTVFARNDLSIAAARVKVELDSPAERDVDLKVQLLPENFEGRSYEKTAACRLPAGQGVQVASVPMPEAADWSPARPHLYRCRVTVLDGGRAVDSKDVLFGCRSFTLVHRDPRPPVYEFNAVKARWLRIACRGSDKNEWNSIWEVDAPAIDRSEGSVTASGSYQDYSPAKALDGKDDTRWGARGRDHWIQFKLNDNVEMDRVKIGWYEPHLRRWDFDLLVSDDGRTWTKLDYKPVAEGAPGPNSDLPSGMLLLNGRPLYLRGTNIHGLNAYAYWGQTDKLLHALLLLKAGNFNIIRVCQHVQMPEVREMLDRVGMMSEQDQGGGYRGSLPTGVRRRQHIHTGTVLARQTYNNPGVVLLCFGNEHQFDTEPILRAALAADPERVMKPISGRFSHSRAPLDLPDDLWAHVIDDGHPYAGWYGGNYPQTWKHTTVQPPRRLVTLGEYGAEALDAYGTMRAHYPDHLKPPPPETDTLWAASQVHKHDARQIVGLGRDPTNLAEYIEASQNYQEAVLADKTIGFRLSPRAVAGYFQFHFLDVVPAFWPKSIVSHDHRPKKAYYQMAQINQPLVALAQFSGDRPDGMTLWVANDLPERFEGAIVAWAASAGKKTVTGSRRIDVPAIDAVQVETVDLRRVTSGADAFELSLTLTDASGRVLSRYERHVRCVPELLLKGK